MGAISLKRNIKKQKLIPIYYNIDAKEVSSKMPFLADIKAIDSRMGIENIANVIFNIVNEVKYTYTNLHNLSLEEICSLLLKKQDKDTRILSKHIKKYLNLIEFDNDMGIVRAKMISSIILKKMLKIENDTTITKDFLDSLPNINYSIKEHFKMIFRFSEIVVNNNEFETTTTINNVELTTLSLKSILNWYYNTYHVNSIVKKRTIVPIPIGEMTHAHIVESHEIEQHLLRKDLISPISQVVDWYNHNYYTMHGIKDKESDKLVGFINALPLTDECYEMIKDGTFPDINIKNEHIRKLDYPDFYKLYISSICIAPEFQNTEAFKILYNSYISIILDLATTHEVYFSEILSDACSLHGERLSNMVGMKYLLASSYGTKIYWGTLIPPKLRLRNNMGKELTKFYGKKFDEFKEFFE